MQGPLCNSGRYQVSRQTLAFVIFVILSLSLSPFSSVSLSLPGSIDVHKMQCDRIQDLLAVNGIVLMLLNKSKSFFRLAFLKEHTLFFRGTVDFSSFMYNSVHGKDDIFHHKNSIRSQHLQNNLLCLARLQTISSRNVYLYF